LRPSGPAQNTQGRIPPGQEEVAVWQVSTVPLAGAPSVEPERAVGRVCHAFRDGVDRPVKPHRSISASPTPTAICGPGRLQTAGPPHRGGGEAAVNGRRLSGDNCSLMRGSLTRTALTGIHRDVPNPPSNPPGRIVPGYLPYLSMVGDGAARQANAIRSRPSRLVWIEPPSD